MTLSQEQRAFAKMLAEFIIWVYGKGYEVTIGEVLRTKEQQDIYIRQGKSKTSNSQHINKLAADLNLFVNGTYVSNSNAYRALGEEWEKRGGRWGGRFGVKPIDYSAKIGWDANHFEWGGKYIQPHLPRPISKTL